MSDDISIKEFQGQVIIVSAGNHNCYLSEEQATKLQQLLVARKLNKDKMERDKV